MATLEVRGGRRAKDFGRVAKGLSGGGDRRLVYEQEEES